MPTEPKTPHSPSARAARKTTAAGDAPADQPKPGQAPSTPYHHGDLHAALLAAAEAIVETEGPDGLSLRAAARAAGVSHAAPKNHFGDLTGLLSELAALGFRRFSQALADSGAPSNPADPAAASASSSASTAPTEARFDAVGRAYVGFAHAHRGLFLLMFRSDRLDANRPALRAALDEARLVLAGAVAQRYDGADPNASLSNNAQPNSPVSPPANAPIDPAQGGAMLRAWSLVHGFSMLLIDGRLDPILARLPPGNDWRVLLDGALAAPASRQSGTTENL